MSSGAELHSERLRLRRWQEADREPFAALNADPQVVEYFPAPLTRAESDGFIARIEAGFDERGYGLWALELRASGEFIGLAGLQPVLFQAHFTPAVEVGWRLARPAWGHGYASEAARTALAFGFSDGGLEEIVAITSQLNLRSMKVMQRIGMKRDPGEDFDHPELQVGDRLSGHVLYRISAADWRG